MRLVGCCVLAGCWSQRPVEPVAPLQSPVVIVDRTSLSADAPAPRTDRRGGIPRHSVWEGTYVCNQGLSAVTLTIDVDHRGNATARYDFGPVPSNPSVPKGAYLLTGVLEPQGGQGFTGELADSEWIDRPPNYFMVPIAVDTDGKVMTGTIRHPSCSGFQATRID